MGISNRVGRVAVLAAALLLSLAGVTHAGGEAGGDITFRLVLRGDVVEGDGFSLAVNPIDNSLIVSPGFICGPMVLEPRAPLPCEADSYEFVVTSTDSLPVGTELEYVWARIPADAPDQIIYTDTITVTEHAQVFTVTYDYGGGSEPDVGALLPDTATSAVPEVVSPAVGLLAGLAALIGAALMGVLLWTGVVRRTTERG